MRPPGASSRSPSSASRSSRPATDSGAAPGMARSSSRATRRDMCVPLRSSGKRDVDVDERDRRLRRAVAVREQQRIAQASDADLVDGEVALVASRLHVGNRHDTAGLFGLVHGVTEDCSGSRRLQIPSGGGLGPRRSPVARRTARRRRPRCPWRRDRQRRGAAPGSPWSMKRSGKPEVQDRHRDAGRRQRFGHRAAGASGDHALLDVTSASCSRASRHHEIDVERLDEAHVGDGRVERLGRRERGMQHRAEGQDRDAMRRVLRLAPQLRPCRSAARSSRLRSQRPARRRADSAPPRAFRMRLPVYSICRHSFSSAGAITVMFGRQRR